ncbi:hypothetical protein [Sphingobacterium sp.]|uniref:hypothetical protein n=1 Tax=Sphingobacterium sp. TaxID=341027 RepID=UPI0028A0B123|nr:hypothetical protein [Sphingobacterium sp.]
MIHFFNSLAILTLVGVSTFFSGLKPEEGAATTVNTKIQYKLQVNSTTNISTPPKKMRQDKIQGYTDSKDFAW